MNFFSKALARMLYWVGLSPKIYVDAHEPIVSTSKWLLPLVVLFQPLKLWQHSPAEYPRWLVPLLWKWAEHSPERFDPRHPLGPRADQGFFQFYNYLPSFGEWTFYAAKTNSTWFLKWWPAWFVESNVLAHVVGATLWKEGATFLWDHNNIKTVEFLFGDAAKHRPEFVEFLRTHPHLGISSLVSYPKDTWTPELLLWVLEGHHERVQSWVELHKQQPRTGWDYLGTMTPETMSSMFDGRHTWGYKFELELCEAQIFDQLFPLSTGWNWSKIFALYGVNTVGLGASVKDWGAESLETIEAMHICASMGHDVPAGALAQAIGWELELLLGHPEWNAWSSKERIEAILGPRNVPEALSVDELI